MWVDVGVGRKEGRKEGRRKKFNRSKSGEGEMQ
jgi:hypothetical protein